MAIAMSKALVFPKAGHFMMQKYKADGTLDPNAVYSSLGGIVRQIQRANNPTTAPLPDGNSNYPAHEYKTGDETTLTIGLSTYDPKLEAFLKGAVVTEPAAETKTTMRTSETVAMGAAVALKEPVKDAEVFILVQDAFGNTLTAAAETPAAGEYKLTVTETTATLAFAEADAGKTAHIIYDAYVSNVLIVAEKEKSKSTAFKIWVFTDAIAYGETQDVQAEIAIDKAVLSGGVTAPVLSNDPTGGYELAIKTAAPRPGFPPVQTKYRPKDAA